MEQSAAWAAQDIKGRPLNARTEVILEPLKARIITKGEGFAYYASMPLQKDATRTLVEKKEFSLIEEPLSEEHLISIEQNTRKLLDEVGLPQIIFDLWVSGDYSAATDGLSLAISQVAMEEYLAARGIQHGSDLYEIATKVLGAHVISYGKDDGSLSQEERDGLPETFTMKNGQLMGSPLSFPILCAINYVAYRSALKKYIKDLGGDWTKAEKLEMPVRVNGDDILFKCNKHFYNDYWKPSVAMIGFTLSPGKNYISSAFLTVNSEGWKPLPNGRFEKVGYLNTGLVYSGPDGSMRPPLRAAHATMPWTGKFQECLNGAQNPKRTIGRLLQFYGKDIKAHTLNGTLNLFARVEQGGLGVRRPPGIEPGWTYYQKFPWRTTCGRRSYRLWMRLEPWVQISTH